MERLLDKNKQMLEGYEFKDLANSESNVQLDIMQNIEYLESLIDKNPR